jgi:hypothetical protein
MTNVNRVQEQNREIKTRIATLERLFCRARRAAMTAAKALSVRQPFADLIARGIKPIENRSWRTRYRGLIYIHVARLPHRMPREEIETVFGVTLEAERVRRDRRPRRACRYRPKFLVALVLAQDDTGMDGLGDGHGASKLASRRKWANATLENAAGPKATPRFFVFP